ncbi:MAG: hypothetical protein E7523_08795 [Ruminococcaceae bacterium]|nr:hypothetical protein [Oscillospiraceae bacterium]
MADYSYAQLSQMQQEAVQRVREMRKKAKSAAEDAARQFSETGQSQQTADVATSGPKVQCIASQTGHCCKKRENTSDMISKLFAGKGIQADDTDKALILSVCFLLYAEHADEELILALLYLLT